MAEPDNIVLEHLRAIRADLGEVKQRIAAVEQTLESKAEASQVTDVDRKLDGLTHVVISSVGSLVRSFESLDQRVSRLEHESKS
jgi:phage shock protein A